MSETTNRIEEIIKRNWMQVDGFTVLEYDKMVKELATKIATHLHQEVIRGKIAVGKAFIDYAVHEQDCICSQWRQGRPTKDGGYETLYGYGSNEKWYRRNEKPECSCGLREIVERLAELQQQLGERQ